MNGIVYVFHGSQQEEKNQAAMAFIADLRRYQKEEAEVKVAFLEHHELTLHTQLEYFCQKTMECLVVVPMLLFPAYHALHDIPEIVADVQRNYPKQMIKVAKTFGSQPEIVDILFARLLSKKKEETAVDGVILAAHGTTRTDVPAQQLAVIANKLAKRAQLHTVPVSLKGASSIAEQLQTEVDAQKNWVVLPLFMYDGFLVRQLKKKMQELPGKFFFAEPLNFDSQMIPAILRVIREAVDE